jgi:hypothetical protein
MLSYFVIFVRYFITMLSYFMILLDILEISSVILVHTLQ